MKSTRTKKTDKKRQKLSPLTKSSPQVLPAKSARVTTKTRKAKPWPPKTTKSKPTKTKAIPKTSTKTKKKPIPTQPRKVWRDSSGRFARAVKFDGLRYRDKSGHVRKFATSAKRPSTVTPKTKAKAPSKPRKAPARVPPKKKPSKPHRGEPVRVKPGKPGKPSKVKPKKAPSKKAPPKKPKKPRKPKEPPKPPKTWITQLFGKNRREKIRPVTHEDRERIKEALEAIDEAKKQAKRHGLPFGPTEPSPVGYQYFELIAAVEKMSPHDVYTLFMSP